VFGERHLRHVLLSYMKYHNEIKTHLSLEKDAPVSRAVKLAGTILCRPVLGRLAPPICSDLIYDRHTWCGPIPCLSFAIFKSRLCLEGRHQANVPQ
jgi:hypothetical protein